MSNTINYQTIILSAPPQFYQSIPNSFNVSSFAKQHLNYFLLADTMQAHFPFHLKFAPFDAYLVLYTVEGKGKLTYKDQTYQLQPHTVMWIDCNAPFELDIFESSHWQFKYIIFKGANSAAYYTHFQQDEYILCPISPISHLPEILNHLINFNKDTPKLAEFIISKLITDLLTELILSKEIDSSQIVAMPKYLSELKNLFDTHYMDHFNLDELADTYHVSKYKIIRDFTTYLHTSPINYLIQKRLQVAKELLRNTQQPVYEIATFVGIDNLNHFTNLFKKNTGVTPITYRKKYHPDSLEFLDE